ncbi:MAG TPA: M20/M25/M40 family metallo-hydrolase [Polyangia bacterium]|jgi:acetylornithine deacetylase
MSLISRLSEWVSFDTQNPSGRERPMVEALGAQLAALGASAVDVIDVGAHAMVYARFGAARPRLLVNAHLDTVPANSGYSRSPFTAVERDGRLYGLGTSDTKGAIAAILEALALARDAGRAPQGVGVLFSGDEERSGTCMRRFLATPSLADGLTHAIVCEPTGGAVGWRHRGIGAAEASAVSPGGHSSRVDHLPNPIAILARAAVALDDMGRRYRDQGPAGFEGLCLNIASLDGGLAFNIIPTRATLRVSLRPAPGSDLQALLSEAERVARAAAAPHELTWSVANENPSFQTRDPASFIPLVGEGARQPVDLAFWTEAALLSAAGIDAVVFGPGRIEQAHAADEFVAIAELEAARDTFVKLFTAERPEGAPR